MHALDLIRKKHAGGKLSAAEIEWLVRGAVAQEIPDYQLSALLMAINYEHLSFNETVALTRAFVESGTVIELPGGAGVSPVTLAGGTPAPPIYVDKHSTGGVGDKVSLILLPLLASMGFKVAKMSGRALGHTGGTIDKLESIPGFRTNLSREEMLRVVDEVGCCIVEQSADLVPADKVFYALRDATDTVGELGLIAASVMSKKIACGAPYIVLDVKCGSGAFFKTLPEARAFAELSQHIGAEFGRKVGCVISSMEQPLGEAVGNAIEVLEALQIMHKQQPIGATQALLELEEVVLSVAHEAQVLRDRDVAPTGYTGIPWRFSHGALIGLDEHFKRWITAQGGNLSAFVETYAPYFASEGIEIKATTNGYVQRITTDILGETLAQLGAGRAEAGDKIDPKVGLLCHARIGNKVEAGEKLATLFIGDYPLDPAPMLASLAAAFEIGPNPRPAPPTVLETIL